MLLLLNHMSSGCRFVLTLGLTLVDKVERRIGPDVRKYPCPRLITAYHKGMGGVDRVDQLRMKGTGFANKSHFKKWYKKAFLEFLT